jgi:hypothetical protein
MKQYATETISWFSALSSLYYIFCGTLTTFLAVADSWNILEIICPLLQHAIPPGFLIPKCQRASVTSPQYKLPRPPPQKKIKRNQKNLEIILLSLSHLSLKKETDTKYTACNEHHDSFLLQSDFGIKSIF